MYFYRPHKLKPIVSYVWIFHSKEKKKKCYNLHICLQSVDFVFMLLVSYSFILISVRCIECPCERGSKKGGDVHTKYAAIQQ